MNVMPVEALMETVRTAAYALWALVGWIAVQELRKIRNQLKSRKEEKERDE